MQYRQSIKVKIEGLNLTRLIKKLVENNVLLNNLVLKNRYVIFEIACQYEVILKKICKIEHKKYVVLKRNALLNHVFNLRYKFGAFLALMLVSIYLFSLNSLIYKINIVYSSSGDFDTKQIMQLINKNGVCVGARKSDISIKEIQNLILENQDDVAGCSVSIVGGRLDVFIYPKVAKKTTRNEDLISKYNAVITRIDVYAGDACVSVGDTVRAGDVLIKNDGGSYGKVYGKVYFSSYLIYNENEIKFIKTGKFLRTYKCSIFKKVLTKSEKQCNFAHYITENCVFYMNNNIFFPVIVNETIFYEVEIENNLIPFNEVEDELKYKLFIETKSLAGNSQITNVTYSIVTENNLTRLDCFVECELELF